MLSVQELLRYAQQANAIIQVPNSQKTIKDSQGIEPPTTSSQSSKPFFKLPQREAVLEQLSLPLPDYRLSMPVTYEPLRPRDPAYYEMSPLELFQLFFP